MAAVSIPFEKKANAPPTKTGKSVKTFARGPATAAVNSCI